MPECFQNSEVLKFNNNKIGFTRSQSKIMGKSNEVQSVTFGHEQRQNRFKHTKYTENANMFFF